jgi:hypothetical protein
MKIKYLVFILCSHILLEKQNFNYSQKRMRIAEQALKEIHLNINNGCDYLVELKELFFFLFYIFS